MIKLKELIKKLSEIENTFPDLFDVKATSIEMHFSIVDNEKNIIIIKDK